MTEEQKIEELLDKPIEFNWLSMSFVVEDETIAYSTKYIVPRKGEYIWLQGSAKEKAKDKYGTSSFIVTDIAHHIISDNKYGYDNIIIYCEPFKTKK